MIRKASYKGSWYPEDVKELDRLCKTDGSGEIRAAILPHAGLIYSAPLISAFFQNLREEIQRVIIISPSHYYPLMDGIFYSSSFSRSETPYGLITNFPFPLSSVPFDDAVSREHGIEMFLPFVAKKKLSVSYALLSRVKSHDDVVKRGEAIAALMDEKTAFIASSDFTHYGRRFGYTPYGNYALERVKDSDYKIASSLAAGDTEGVFSIHENTTICGIAGAMILSYAAKLKGLKGEVGDHYTSYDVYPDRADDFVSYFDVFWK